MREYRESSDGGKTWQPYEKEFNGVLYHSPKNYWAARMDAVAEQMKGVLTEDQIARLKQAAQ